MASEQRAFAAVSPDGQVEILTIREDESEAERLAVEDWFVNWPASQKDGWRIRPVVIRVEDENEGATAHD